MFDAQIYSFKQPQMAPDGIGGVTQSLVDTQVAVYGWLDMINGTQGNAIQNAFVESSTHVLVTDGIASGVKTGMVTEADGKLYEVTFVDNPNHINHHLEIYLRYSGDDKGAN